MHKKMSRFDFVFESILVFIIAVISLICLLPFVHVLALSFSDSYAVNAGLVTIFPVGWNVTAYKRVFDDALLMQSLWFSIGLTIGKVILSLIFTSCLAYPLARRNFKWRGGVMKMVLFTMYFSGGTIPSYLLIMNLGLYDSIGALLFPSLISVYNLIVMKTFFQNISETLIESVKIDGCGEFRAFTAIVLPLSKPIMATMALFYGVSRWNTYSDVLYYINSAKYTTLQMRLQQVISANQIAMDAEELLANQGALVESDTLKSACLIFATVPILLLYPYLQKYFVKGMQLGGVKE